MINSMIMKKIIKSYLEYDLKQNEHVKHFFLLNSANAALSTISAGRAKIGKMKQSWSSFKKSLISTFVC